MKQNIRNPNYLAGPGRNKLLHPNPRDRNDLVLVNRVIIKLDTILVMIQPKLSENNQTNSL